MPVTCKLIDGKWRLVKSDGTVENNAQGTAVDGGGHEAQNDCMSQARAVNSRIESSFSTVYIEKETSPWKLSDEKERVYRKEVIYEGDFLLQDDKGTRFRSKIDTAKLDHWAATFQQMDRNGVKVPVPIKHTRDVDAKRGSVIALKREENDKGVPALFAYVQFDNEKAEEVGKKSDVSIWVDPELTDGKGNVYKQPITHVALTNYPVIPGLGEFQAIAASRTLIKKEPKKMGIRSLAQSLGINVDEHDSDDKLESAIAAAFTGIKGDLKAAKAAGKKDPEKKPEVKIAASLLNMATEHRQGKLKALVVDGKILPAVAKELSDRYCTEPAIALSLSDDAPDDGFDATIAALSKNDSVISFDEKSGSQTVSLASDKNPLLRDAENRAKAAAG